MTIHEPVILINGFVSFSSAKNDFSRDEKRNVKSVPKDPEIIMPANDAMPANEVPEKDASSMEGCPEFSPTNAEQNAGGVNLRNSAVHSFGQRVAHVTAKINESKEAQDDLVEPVRKKKKSNKTVKWAAPENLE